MARRPGSTTASPDVSAAPPERLAVARLMQRWFDADTDSHTMGLLEAKSGISRQSLSSIIHLKTSPSPDTCKKLAAALDESAETVLCAAGYLSAGAVPVPRSPESVFVPPLHDERLRVMLRHVGLLPPESLDRLHDTLLAEYERALGPGVAPGARPWFADLPDEGDADDGF